jgi:dolichyl-phosphate-mannose-protein mannosyltransferase
VPSRIGASTARGEEPINRQPAWARLDWLLISLVTAGAGLVRLAGLSRPVGLVFDEIFYAQNACRYVIGTGECGIEGLASRAHPPLGNWIIGLGIKLFGYEAFGWRVMAAVAGTITVALLYLLMRRLFAGHLAPTAASIGATASAGLLGTDLLHVAQSRVGMLDASLTLFVVAAVTFAVLDRDRTRDRPWRSSPAGWLRRLALGRPWLLLTGASLGAAIAVKWSGAYLALGLLPLIAAWEISARRRGPDLPDATPRPWRSATWLAIREEGPRGVILLGLVPVVVYLCAYIGRMPGELIGLPWQEGTVWRGIWEHQADMLRFHTTLAGDHPYESPPWSWLLIKRPVAYYFAVQDDSYREILALGNPLTWWPAALALVGISFAWLRARADARRPELVLLVAALATYLPWLILSGSRSQVFIWYLLPTIPFLYGALGVLAGRLWSSLAGRIAGGAYAAVVLASFIFFFPIVSALPISPDEWRARIWFSWCERPGAQTLTLPDDQINSGPAPRGWCWI